MSLTKFAFLPESAGYSVEDPNEVIAIKLDGGASRYRRDKLGSTSKVSVRWTFDREGYRYFRAFYRSLLERGSSPFLIDLVLDVEDPVEHQAYFVPGSVRLAEQRGHYYGVTAELEAYPTDINEADEIDLVFMYNNFGSNWQLYEDQLDVLMNYTWPEVL